MVIVVEDDPLCNGTMLERSPIIMTLEANASRLLRCQQWPSWLKAGIPSFGGMKQCMPENTERKHIAESKHRAVIEWNEALWRSFITFLKAEMSASEQSLNSGRKAPSVRMQEMLPTTSV